MKERLDVILVNNGLASSRDNAKRTIMAGLVTVDGIVETKSGQKFDVDSEFKVKDKLLKYVSRGGLKLEKAIQSFNIKLNGCYAVDMGASTGGFTDCMLMNGALKVYALDVGYGQLDYKLRVDPRVINMEKTNIRYLDTTLIEEPIDFISIDVSFISLRHMFPVASEILKDTGAVMCLIKPQFEAGREQVGKKGIVRDSKIHVEVIENVISYASDNGLFPHGLDYSPVKGTKGNIEYLLYLKKTDSSEEISPQEVVNKAHGELDY
ncbi:TlyA family RNA methyltransferase [Mogibacterium diversum]